MQVDRLTTCSLQYFASLLWGRVNPVDTVGTGLATSNAKIYVTGCGLDVHITPLQHDYTHTHTHTRLMALCPGLPG